MQGAEELRSDKSSMATKQSLADGCEKAGGAAQRKRVGAQVGLHLDAKSGNQAATYVMSSF